MCFKWDKEEYATGYQQNSSEEKENEKVMGISNDAELVIHCASRAFHEYKKIWSPKFEQKLKIKRDKINLFDP